MPGISPEKRFELLTSLLDGLSEMAEGCRLEVVGKRTGDEMTLEVARQRIEMGMQQQGGAIAEINTLKESGQL